MQRRGGFLNIPQKQQGEKQIEIKNYEKKLLFTLLSTFFIVNLPVSFLMGQNEAQVSPYDLKMQTFSPQVAGVIRYDKVGTPLNKGLVDLNVPLIAYKDRDFELPIGLKYDSQGFSPADAGNFVGLNWDFLT